MRTKTVAMILALALCGADCRDGGQIGSTENGARASAPRGEASTSVVETIDGVRHVHNVAPKWRGGEAVRLAFVRKFGEFYKPFDLCLDASGHIYVTDSGNSRVLKLSPEGQLVGSFGRRGQGPGEFQIMGGVAVDGQGRLYVTDRTTNRLKVLSARGDEARNVHLAGITGEIGLLGSGEAVVTKGLLFSEASVPGLLLVVDGSGRVLRTVGRQEPRDDWDEYRYFNRTALATDQAGRIYLAYGTRNRIERYDPEGSLDLVMDRPLNYDVSETVGQVKRRVGPREMELPQVNIVSKAIAVDDAGRIWVLSLDRQLTFEEQPVVLHLAGEGPGLEGTETLKSPETVRTAAFVFHVFERSGEFLGKVPLDHFADRVRIVRDRLYILEMDKEMCVYEYRIVGSDR